MMKLFMCPHRAGRCNPDTPILRPTTRATEEALRAMEIGAVGEVTIKQGRNVKHSSKYWARLYWLVNNVDMFAEFKTTKDLDIAISEDIGRGHYEIVRTFSGNVFHKFKKDSKSFKAMSQADFAEVYKESFEAIDRVYPGLDWDQIDKRS